nr:DUF1661 domain-containing protein [Porphyromonas gulae]
MPFLKTWREKNSALARDFFNSRAKTFSFWRDFFKIPVRLSGYFWLEIRCPSFVRNLSYGVSFALCKECETSICEIFSRFSCFSGLVR